MALKHPLPSREEVRTWVAELALTLHAERDGFFPGLSQEERAEVLAKGLDVCEFLIKGREFAGEIFEAGTLEEGIAARYGSYISADLEGFTEGLDVMALKLQNAVKKMLAGGKVTSSELYWLCVFCHNLHKVLKPNA